ncbi:MAG: DNA repair protein RecN [Candidatus Dadabacteria bacterium]|nr:DNA repair protein RecN [Candidatus Dadabacteria bacterium]MYA47673.1 DNA repair protein RecN [Candidatus Dadabacteria bacterium]MYF48041.1 DNA repair protein RecN [Candidatus Dadabacteria bacterium]MYG83554.1 DNA repair protein RecN [Candidatus Dadabacteria bacterium]MYK49773.1 DNA repair protein RecN [Candidatus Dadabacteria bacterium]
MLVELRLKNFAIIDDISISFGDNLNIITGETGTGKSLIVDAINIILGDRFTSEHVKSAGEQTSVEALFEVPGDLGIGEKLERFGIGDSEGELVVKRVFNPGGKNRIYINGSIVTLGTLSEVTDGLVNMFGQHEHQDLLKKSNYLNYLDAFSELEYEVSQYKAAYVGLVRSESELEALRKKEREGAEKEDYLRFQAEEIKKVSPAPNEDSELEAQRVRLENSERFSSSLTSATGLLYEGESSAVGFLKQTLSHLEDVSDLDSSLGELRERIAAVLIETEDVFYGLSEFAGKIEHNPERLEEVLLRLEEIGRLKRKHGDSIEEIIKKQQQIESELEGLENSAGMLEEMGRRRDLLREKVSAAASSISANRKKGARRLEELFCEQAESVGLKNARFEVEFTEKDLSGDGRDSVQFLFSANPGQVPRPVSRVASGGELSRIMLLLKSFVSTGDAGSIFIFDEVDAGIGGVVAESIGRKIKDLSDRSQVVCITHLPQVAKFANTHLLVAKELGESETDVSVDALSEEERVMEIGRMLAGKSVSEKTFEVARELIKGAS